MRSTTVIVIRWKQIGKIEVFVNLAGIYKKYRKNELSVSRFTLDRKDLLEGYENDLIELSKHKPQ